MQEIRLTELFAIAYDGHVLLYSDIVPMHKRRLLVALLVVLLLGGVVLGVYLVQQQQSLNQHAANTTTTDAVATVDNQPITLSDLRTIAKRQYKESAIDATVLQKTLDDLLTDRLLQNEAKKRGLNVSQGEITGQAQLISASDSASFAQGVLDEAQEQALKDKITRAVATTREAYTIGFWVPPSNYDVQMTSEERQIAVKQRAIRDQVLTDIRQQLTAGDEPLQVAQAILKTYPILAPILSVNGYILEKNPPEELLTNPILYDLQTSRSKNPFFATLFAMQTGDIQKIISSSNGGGFVVKVTAATTGQYNSFQDWLNASKKNRTHIIKKP
jgi:hypothetical protein